MRDGGGKTGWRYLTVKPDALLVVGIIVLTSVLMYSIYRQVWREQTIGPNGGQAGFKPDKEDLKTVSIEPKVSGTFYPSDPKELSDMVDGFLNQAEKADVYGIRALVVPHAGYVYSGPVAAYAYKQLQNKRYETVIVLGPSHYYGFGKASIPSGRYYKTPLGYVELSPKIREMNKEEIFKNVPEAYEKEHSVEVQIPFLQKVLPKFKLIPIVVGNVDPKMLANALSKYIDDDTLVVASSDLSHYHPYNEAIRLDSNCIKAIPSLNFSEMELCEACGEIPILTIMHLARRNGWDGRLLDYRNSGDTAGDKSNGVVGYSAIAFSEGLAKEEREFLLKLVRSTLTYHYTNGSKPMVDESRLTPRLIEPKACFVTLHEYGELRGCIGHLTAQMPLYECVMDNALNAALHDSRFKPVESSEMKDIRIEVSALSEPRILPHESPEDLEDKLINGTDGVIIKYGWGQSTFLPTVWDIFPEKEDFLNNLCRKGGNPTDCWKAQEAEIYTYQAQNFGE